MTAGDSSTADIGRLLGASAVLGLAGRGDGIVRRTPVGRLAWARDGEPGARRLARALRRTATGRLDGAERENVERVEERRGRLAAEHGPTGAVFTEGDRAEEGRFGHVGREGPVAEKCGTISIPARWGVLLVRLVREFRPRSCVELGTGFGLSAAFIASALELNGDGRLSTFEGSEEWAAIAREGATELDIGRVDVRVGSLSETLPASLPELAPVDFAFVDAEHTKESTLRYFEQLLPHASPGAVLLFDDIDFDRGMWEAWEEIRDHPRVGAWVALGRLGLVMTR
jgi:predicted O-methyltransferase YrrM